MNAQLVYYGFATFEEIQTMTDEEWTRRHNLLKWVREAEAKAGPSPSESRRRTRKGRRKR